MAEQVTIADLNLRLRSEGEEAAKGIDALANAFKNLDSAGGGLNSIQASLKKIADSFGQITKAASKASSFTSAMPKVAPQQTAATKNVPPSHTVKQDTAKVEKDYGSSEAATYAAAAAKATAETRAFTAAQERLFVATKKLAGAYLSGEETQIASARARVNTATQQVVKSQEKLNQLLSSHPSQAESSAKKQAAALSSLSNEELKTIAATEKLTAATIKYAQALKTGTPEQQASAHARLASATRQTASAQDSAAKKQESAASATSKNASAYERLRSTMSKITSVASRVANVFKRIITNTISATRNIVKFFNSGKEGQGLLRTLQLIRVNIYNIWYLAQVLGNAFNALFDKASESYEVLHLFKAAFSDGSAAGDELAQTTYDVYQNLANLAGLDIVPMARTAAVFKEMSNAMGMANDASDKIAKGLTQLTYDYASLFDMDFDVVAGKFQSALSGQTRAIRTFGLDVTQAALQQELLNMGINRSVTELTRAEKTILIYNTIMKNSKNAQQDFAASVMQPANLLRVLREQISITARSFGALFIPAIQAVLPWVIAFANALNALIGRLLGFFGIKLPDIGSVAAGGLEDVGGVTEDLTDELGNAESAALDAGRAIKKMRDYVTGLDELNILKPDEDVSSGGGGGGGGGGSGAGIGGIEPVDPYDFLGDFDPLKTILEKLGPGMAAINAAWLRMEANIADVFKAIKKSYDTLVEKGVIDTFKQSVNKLAVTVLDTIGRIAGGFAKAWQANDLGTKVLESIFVAMTGILDVATLILDAIGKWFWTDTGQKWVKEVLEGFKGIHDAIITVTDGFKDIWEKGGRTTFQEHILPALGSIITMFETIYENIILIIGGFVNWALESGFLETMSNILSNITGLVKDIVTEVERWFNGPDGEPFRAAIQGIADAIERAVIAVRDWWNHGGDKLMEMFATDIAEFVESIANFVAKLAEMNVLTGIVAIASGVLDLLTWLVDNTDNIGGVAIALGIIWAGMKLGGIAMSIISAVGTPASAAITAIGKAGASAAGGVLSLALGFGLLSLEIMGIGLVVALILALLPPVLEEIRMLIETVLTKIEEIIRTVGDVVIEIVDTVLTKVEEIIRTVGDVIVEIIDTVGGVIEDIIQTVGDVIVDIIDSVGDTVSQIIDSIAGGIETVLNAIGDLADKLAGSVDKVLTSLAKNLERIGAVSAKYPDLPLWLGAIVAELLAMTAGNLVDGLASIFGGGDSIVKKAAEDFRALGEAVKSGIAEAINAIIRALESMMNVSNISFAASVKGAETARQKINELKDALDAAKRSFSDMGTEAKKAGDNVSRNFTSAVKELKPWWSNFWADLWRQVSTGASSAFSNVGAILRGQFNNVISIVNGMVSRVNNVVTQASRMPNAPRMSYMYQLPYLARGGMIDGGLFVAGEAGPELVGKYKGNANTVMPLENSGFVEAMASSVYAAVMSAMRESDSGGGTSDVYIDGVKAGKAIKKAERVSGISGSLVSIGV